MESLLMEPDRLAQVFAVLATDARVRITRLLKEGPLCVNALARRLQITPAAVSQHLRVLRSAGVVTAEKHGYYVHYQLNEETLALWRKETCRLLDPAFGVGEIKERGKICAAIKKKNAVRSRKT